MKKTNKKTNQETKKRTASPSLLEGLRKLLAEVHPCLPAYFYGGDGILAPLPIDKEGEDKMAELGLTRLVQMDILTGMSFGPFMKSWQTQTMDCGGRTIPSERGS